MYANAENLVALPTALAAFPAAGRDRRRQVGQVRLDPAELARFNHLVLSLGRPQPLALDQLVTAARQLEGVAEPECIRQRLGRAEAILRMLADGAWAPANEVLDPARAVADYVQRADDLIPDWVPAVGRLDDAIVVEAAWPRLGGEVLDYLDFCRLRAIEAELRGECENGFCFGRREWSEARVAEAALREHRSRVREGCYVPRAVSYFRVH